MPLLAGYRLDHVAVNAVDAFVDDSTAFLLYTREGAATSQLVLTQFRAASKETIIAPIAAGVGRGVAVGDRSGLFVEGMRVECGDQRFWEIGTVVRLIIEDGPQVGQFEAGHASGSDDASLVALAQRLR